MNADVAHRAEADLDFFCIGIVIQELLCKYLKLKFEVGFIRSQNLGDKLVIIFSKGQQNNKSILLRKNSERKTKEIKKSLYS